MMFPPLNRIPTAETDNTATRPQATQKSGRQPRRAITTMQVCEDSALARAGRSNVGSDRASGAQQKVERETVERTETRPGANRGGDAPASVPRSRKLQPGSDQWTLRRVHAQSAVALSSIPRRTAATAGEA